MCPLPNSRPIRREAFSLIELLAVMAIIAIMLSLLAPTISSFSGIAGRSGAVNILMNTMEQARVSALESGRTVYVVFNRRTFPDPDAIMVVRDPETLTSNASSSNSSSSNSTAPPAYEQLTKWIPLPKGILLHNVGNNILKNNLSLGTTAGNFDKSLMPVTMKNNEQWDILAFNAYGGVSFPNSSDIKLMLIVAEGVRDSGRMEALISPGKDAGGFEIISLRRYTGRASLEVTTL